MDIINTTNYDEESHGLVSSSAAERERAEGCWRKFKTWRTQTPRGRLFMHLTFFSIPFFLFYFSVIDWILKHVSFTCFVGLYILFRLARRYREILKHGAQSFPTEIKIKAVAFHPTGPWIVMGFHTGHVAIWKGEEQDPICYAKVSSEDLSVRVCHFLVKEGTSWIIAGYDPGRMVLLDTDGHVCLDFKAHKDSVRGIEEVPDNDEVGSSRVLTCSDDMTAKLWRLVTTTSTKGHDSLGGLRIHHECLMTYRGHEHFVTSVKLNPQQSSNFITASKDTTIKFWSLSECQNEGGRVLSSLEGHERGVTCIAFPTACDAGLETDSFLLVSGAEDHTICLWNYEACQCLQVLQGHCQPLADLLFHPTFPILISLSQGAMLVFWDLRSGNAFQQLNCTWQKDDASSVDSGEGFPCLLRDEWDRCWGLDAGPNSNQLVVASMAGAILLDMHWTGVRVNLCHERNLTKELLRNLPSTPPMNQNGASTRSLRCFLEMLKVFC